MKVKVVKVKVKNRKLSFSSSRLWKVSFKCALHVCESDVKDSNNNSLFFTSILLKTSNHFSTNNDCIERQKKCRTRNMRRNTHLTNGSAVTFDPNSASKVMSRSALICSSGKVFNDKVLNNIKVFKINCVSIERTNTRLTANALTCLWGQWTLTFGVLAPRPAAKCPTRWPPPATAALCPAMEMWVQ